MRIVPAFDERQHCRKRFGWGVEGGAVKQFAFEGGEEALRELELMQPGRSGAKSGVGIVETLGQSMRDGIVC